MDHERHEPTIDDDVGRSAELFERLLIVRTQFHRTPLD